MRHVLHLLPSIFVVILGVFADSALPARAEEFPKLMGDLFRPGMHVGTPRTTKRNQVFVILGSERHGQIFQDALRSLPELREKYPEIDEHAATALKDYIEKLRATKEAGGDVSVKEPTLKFSWSASSYGNNLYFSTVVHVGADYIVLETSDGKREAVRIGYIESIEWAPTDLSRSVTIEAPNDSNT